MIREHSAQVYFSAQTAPSYANAKEVVLFKRSTHSIWADLRDNGHRRMSGHSFAYCIEPVSTVMLLPVSIIALLGIAKSCSKAFGLDQARCGLQVVGERSRARSRLYAEKNGAQASARIGNLDPEIQCSILGRYGRIC